MVNTCYPMSVAAEPDAGGLAAVYAATATDAVVRYHRAEKAALFTVLAEVIARWRSRLRIFTPLCALHHLHRQNAHPGPVGYPCRGGVDFFFIDARDGLTYPCGYRGAECLGPFTPDPCRADGNDCRRCDWECFRDPSALFGPLLALRRGPIGLAGAWRRDPVFFRLWRRDLCYYFACDFFDGRLAPDLNRMERAAAQEPGSIFGRTIR